MATAAQAACWEGPVVEAAGRVRAERTPNMYCMVVTLDVSRLSGWLNAEAPCRVTRRHMEGDTPGEGREGVGAVAVHAACTEGPGAMVWYARGGTP